MTIEEALHQAEEGAALLQYLAHAAPRHEDPPSRAVWFGILNICERIEELTGAIQSALSAQVLATELKRRTHART